jgi:hypothetical protein
MREVGNRHETEGQLKLFGASGRARRVEVLRRLAETTLPAQAAGDARYPVRFGHCFKRIAFDAAVGARWDTVVARPFYRNASREQLRRAVDVLRQMAGAPERVRALNRQSLRYRGEA